MASCGAKANQTVDDEEKKDDESAIPTYQVSKRVSVSQLKDKDKDDKELNTYKEKLLGKNTSKVFDAKLGPVIFDQLNILMQDGSATIELKPDNLAPKKIAFKIKEKAEIRKQLKFRIQKEIVSALRYKCITQKSSGMVSMLGKLASVTDTEVVGSYAPGQAYERTFDIEEIPSGSMARGKYQMTVIIFDDDHPENNPYHKLEFMFEITK